MMASTTFLLQLQNYPKDSINDEMIDFLQPYFAMEVISKNNGDLRWLMQNNSIYNMAISGLQHGYGASCMW